MRRVQSCLHTRTEDTTMQTQRRGRRILEMRGLRTAFAFALAHVLLSDSPVCGLGDSDEISRRKTIDAEFSSQSRGSRSVTGIEEVLMLPTGKAMSMRQFCR